MIHPSGQRPTISTSLNKYYSWPVIHLVVSAGVFHISLRPQKIQPRGWKEEKTNNMDLGQFQAQEREFCVTLHSSCIRRLSPACILRETSSKGTNNADIFSRWLTRPLCSSSGLSSRLSDFCWLPSRPCFHLLLPSSADFCQIPLSVFLCQLTLCLLSDLFWSRRRSRAQALCLGFVAEQTERFFDRRTHTQPTVTVP